MNLIIRILGNDLSGLHGSDQTITNLKFTLEHEPNFPNTKKLFLLNRIYNTEKRQNIIKLLEKHSVDYIELPFQLSEFNKLKYGKNNNKFLKYYEYNLYLVNNNGSRNYCIDYGKKNGYNWTFALDSNAFFTQNMWDNIFDNLKPETEYISLPQKRLSEKNLSNETILNNLDLDLLPEQEPQIAFHKNSKLKYNDKIPYGSSPKAEMLRVLKVPGKWNKWRDNFTIYNIPDRKYHDVNFQNLSSVIRLNSQNKNRKDSVKNNYHARINGVENLVNKIKNENENKLDIIEGFSDNNNLKNNLILLLFLVLIVLSSLKKNKIYSIIILILIFIKLTTINKSEHFTNQNNNKIILNIDKPKIVLITQFYIPKDDFRKEEIKKCLINNINNKLIDRIILFGEKQYNFPKILGTKLNLDKLEYINIKKRLSFKDVFKHCNNDYEKKQIDSIYILCNSDIYFNHTLLKLSKLSWNKKFLAISRIDVKPEGNKYHKKPQSSQDTWIWKNKIDVSKDPKFKSYQKDGILLGVPGCDNYIVYLMNYSGYKVENKCKLIETFHLHQNDFRTWSLDDPNSYRNEFYQQIKCT